VSGGVGGRRPRSTEDRGRLSLLGVATVLVALVLLPPVGSLARRYAFVGAVQFGVFATIVPALVVVAAPWRTAARGGRVHAVVARLAARRRRHRSVGFGVASLVAYLAAAVGWRVPPSVDALVRVPALSVLEAVTLVGAGLLLWLELVAPEPFAARCPIPGRMALGAVAMWVTWIMAYLLGMSHADWFPAYHHVAGAGLSLIADQQLTAGMLWLLAAVAFVPLLFASLVVWLRSGDDPDEEMRRLVRVERRRRWAEPRPPATGGRLP
jgi:cytochrome c oxidase assembly factor CtaG